jgi:hypothetical protein
MMFALKLLYRDLKSDQLNQSLLCSYGYAMSMTIFVRLLVH